ncbi:hypothetical protein N9924_00785 [bacterium]|nr:hypothetical protein [bacterium]
MARTVKPVEVNTFVKGLITEAGPLTFPEGASVNEDNFVLNRDGTRRRRLGMDLEEGHQEITTSVTVGVGADLGVSTYSWENAAGDSAVTLAVVQIGNEIKIYDASISPLSSGLLHTHAFTGVAEGQIFSYATVDGLLVVATGLKNFSVFEFDGVSTFTLTEDSLKIRDLFGVEDIESGTGDDLRAGTNVAKRPALLGDVHNYNLRNQTFAEPRMTDVDATTLVDPVSHFYAATTSTQYPSNADSVLSVLYADANLTSNRTAERFHAKDLVSNPLGTTPAPKGYFIIDAMERGASRITEVTALAARHPVVSSLMPASLPADSTPGGPSAVAEFAGHVFFGGFSSSVTTGDKNSPRMGSYILFSELVEDVTDVARCYQEADPTSRDQSDLVPTDGGFLRLDGAFDVKKLVNVGTALVVLASNGVWAIRGGSDFGFSADNILVEKITDRGCEGANSVVVVDNTVMYWGIDGIYHIAPTELGSYKATSLTQNTIQLFYNDIDSADKSFCQGIFDDFERKVRWTYQNRYGDSSQVKELLLDLTLGAFYTHTIGDIGVDNLPLVVAPLRVPPFKLRDDAEQIFYGSEQVLYNLEDVELLVRRKESITRSTFYVVITDKTSTVKYSFSNYRDETFVDWKTVDSVGVDASAFLITGYTSGGDFQRNKQVPYVTFHFRRTEDGVEEDGTGDFTPTKPSGCKVQAQWDWANSVNSNRWGREFQAYRYKRAYFPSSIADPFDTGFEVVTTKNKLRGKGKVLSMLLKSEPGKDLNLLGWSMIVGVSGNV